MLSPHALELAQTLVRMNTVSQNSNLELIHFVRDTLAKLGVTSRLTFNADKTKANLFATLGEGKPSGIILSGHTDTVPWTGQDWSMDPLSALVQDGKLYGRGSPPEHPSQTLKTRDGLLKASRMSCITLASRWWRGSGEAARRLFAANSPAIGKKSNAADCPSRAITGRRE